MAEQPKPKLWRCRYCGAQMRPGSLVVKHIQDYHLGGK